jgi:hypothetical protein
MFLLLWLAVACSFLSGFLDLVLMKDKDMRLLCHVYFFSSFGWLCLNMNELQIITIWMTSFIKFVFRLFTRFCLFLSLAVSPSSTPICTSLHTVIQSQYIYIRIDKRRADPKGYIPAVSYSLDLRNWCMIRIFSQCSSTCLNIHLRIIVNEKRKFEIRHTSFKFYNERESVIVALVHTTRLADRL